MRGRKLFRWWLTAVLLVVIAAPTEAQSLRVDPRTVSVNAWKLVQSPTQPVASGKQLRRRRTLKFVLIGGAVGFAVGAWMGRQLGGDTDVRTDEIWKGGVRAGAIGAAAGFLLSKR